jgi:hypothetical protein
MFLYGERRAILEGFITTKCVRKFKPLKANDVSLKNVLSDLRLFNDGDFIRMIFVKQQQQRIIQNYSVYLMN